MAKGPMMTMKPGDVTLRRRLVKKFELQCIVCGHDLANLACVTKEHIIPRSMGGKHADNMAGSHYRCNMLRGVGSIIVASRTIEHKRRMMKPAAFLRWLNAPIPHRIVPPEALEPLVRLRPLRTYPCLVPPEHLPGM